MTPLDDNRPIYQVRVRHTQTRTWLIHAGTEEAARETALYWAERFFHPSPKEGDKLKVVSTHTDPTNQNIATQDADDHGHDEDLCMARREVTELKADLVQANARLSEMEINRNFWRKQVQAYQEKVSAALLALE